MYRLRVFSYSRCLLFFAVSLSLPTNVRPCEHYVFSGCNSQWQYCGCDVPAVNLSAIPLNATVIELGDRHSWTGLCTPSCLLDTFAPLPHRHNVTKVRLYNIWAAPNDRPFPVARFLLNVRSTLKFLTLSRIFLPRITRGTFAGMTALRGLALAANRMSAIDADAFSVVDGRSDLPQLIRLSITYNNITMLDWNVFKPLTRSVETIDLTNNNIQRIFLSGFFVSHIVEVVDLTNNPNLTSIDDSFLRSIHRASRWPRPYLGLRETPLCSSVAQCPRITKIYGPLEDCCRDTAG
ncbi:uncharacterized protein LOC129601467 [Paramacrobiotus metropolitanus]|uniref:uncharacterized protein LOC129601467 n=1 Tax=Paramacrobiotus metropolitanus TaxID=2943436 RepID=UPI0024463D66|nr:uncharacterized protein LOC129601467 [Paramacrobiotus metropolitanus]